MISGSELRRGIVIELDGKLYQVMDYEHVKQKRTALAKVKLRDVQGGHTFERSFQSDEKLVRARIELRDMQYLYRDEHYHFMDIKTYEQMSLSENQVRENKKFLLENIDVSVTFYKGEAISIELPVAIEAKIIKTEPGVKGDTVSTTYKPAEIETGAKIQVPLFINEGDIIKIDTRTGEYITRISK